MSVWERVPAPMQAAVEQAWEAGCAGTAPIGAAIADAHGAVIARARNRILDREPPPAGQVAGSRIAHAEINALAMLDYRAFDLAACTLYTTLEPCPMCTGAIRMCHVGRVCYAARDPFGGGLGLLEASPFMRMRPPALVGPAVPELEEVLAALHSAFFSAFLLGMGQDRARLEALLAPWDVILPRGVALGRTLAAEGSLPDQCARWGSAPAMVEQLAARLQPAYEAHLAGR
jgi:tRNA(Arg) A34 adenosine deaminase TadA